MAARDADLHRLSGLLGQCLARIDEEAYRIETGDDDYDTADRLDEHTATVHELIGSLLLAGEAADRAELGRTLRRVVQVFVDELTVPLVVRQRIDADLASIALPPGPLAYVLHRALSLVALPLGPGGELSISARANGDATLVELTGSGPRNEEHVADRAVTLAEFVAECGGRCRVGESDDELSLVLELPLALLPDERV